MASDTRALNSICLLIVDCPHSTPVWTDSGYVVLRNQNIRDGRLDLSGPSFTDAEHFAGRNRRAKPRAGDIVITREAPMGEVCMIPTGLECCLGQRQVLLRPNPELVNPKFLLYALQSPEVKHQIGWNEGTGSTVSNIRIPILKALSIPAPKRHAQDHVAEILGALDDRIDNLRQTNATFEAIAQALFKSWFVDFDPVRAKAEGRVPEGMDAVTAALFPSEFEDSELGPIPKGWRCRPLGDALEVQIGGAWGEEAESAKASVNVSCMRGIDAVEIGAGRKPDVPKRWITPKQIAARALREGDILVEGSGSFCGRSLYWIESYADLLPLTPVYSNFVKRLASPQGREVSYWASQHLTQVFQSDEIVSYRTGSAFPNLDTAGLLLKNIATPDTAKIATSLYELVRPLLEAKKQNIDRAATLADLRNTLLPRLISGKLRLPEAEREVEAATA